MFQVMGHPGSVVLPGSHFFVEPTPRKDVYARAADSTRQHWTHPSLPDKRLAGKDEYVLTSTWPDAYPPIARTMARMPVRTGSVNLGQA